MLVCPNSMPACKQHIYFPGTSSFSKAPAWGGSLPVVLIPSTSTPSNTWRWMPDIHHSPPPPWGRTSPSLPLDWSLLPLYFLESTLQTTYIKQRSPYILNPIMPFSCSKPSTSFHPVSFRQKTKIFSDLNSSLFFSSLYCTHPYLSGTVSGTAPPQDLCACQSHTCNSLPQGQYYFLHINTSNIIFSAMLLLATTPLKVTTVPTAQWSLFYYCSLLCIITQYYATGSFTARFVSVPCRLFSV